MRGTPYPPYVRTDDERRRWDWATLIALAMNAQAVDAGSAYPFPDQTFVFHTTRALYTDESLTLGTADEFLSDLKSAVELGLVPANREI